jgi:hypothetical protein
MRKKGTPKGHQCELLVVDGRVDHGRVEVQVVVLVVVVVMAVFVFTVLMVLVH